MIECKICGKKYHSLTSHLTRTHKIELQEHLQRKIDVINSILYLDENGKFVKLFPLEN